MGLTRTGTTWLASGHPGHEMQAPSNLGLGSSADGALWRTDNLGRTWKQLGTSPLFDLAIAPANTSIVFGATQNGVIRSVDGGTSFTQEPDAPLLALLSAIDSGIYGVGIDGTIYFSSDDGKSWQSRGALGSQPTAFIALKTRVVALVGDVVVESSDRGQTFHDRLTLSNTSSDTA